jgi:uncharacterized paraquat-inducible protein A
MIESIQKNKADPTSYIKCPKCKAYLDDRVLNLKELTPCPSCNVPIRVDVYPAMFTRPKTGVSGDTLHALDEASCFYHSEKQAVTYCSRCGRFLCALCDLEFGQEHLCTKCFETNQEKQVVSGFDNYRVLYDNVALFLVAFSLIPVFWFFSFLTAPAALFVVVRHWKTPLSIIPRSKIRFIVAFLLSSAQLTGWTLLIIAIAT